MRLPDRDKKKMCNLESCSHQVICRSWFALFLLHIIYSKQCCRRFRDRIDDTVIDEKKQKKGGGTKACRAHNHHEEDLLGSRRVVSSRKIGPRHVEF